MRTILILALCLFLITPTFAQAKTKKYFVEFRRKPSYWTMRKINKLPGVRIIDKFKYIPFAVVEADPNMIGYIKRVRGIKNVEEVPERKFFYRTQSYFIPWGIERIRAPASWNNSMGENVSVAVLDTGIDVDHPDLINQLVECVSFFVLPNGTLSSCNDPGGHGTHVSGIIAADGTIRGVAPGVNLYMFRIGGRGGISLDAAIDAMEYAIAQDVDVISMSWGGPRESAAERAMIKRLYKNGILLIAAAGNRGAYDFPVAYPAAYPEVIAVSASDINNEIASFSTHGKEVEVAAPGVNVYSTYLNGTYKYLSGTSMSTPHVTGLSALYISEINEINPDIPKNKRRDLVRFLLKMETVDLESPGKDNYSGWGLIQSMLTPSKYSTFKSYVDIFLNPIRKKIKIKPRCYGIWCIK